VVGFHHMTHARDAHQASEHTNKKKPADTSDEQDKHKSYSHSQTLASDSHHTNLRNQHSSHSTILWFQKYWKVMKRMVPFVLCLAWRRHFLIHGTHHVIALFHHHSWAEQLSLHKLPAHVTAVTAVAAALHECYCLCYTLLSLISFAPLSNVKAICDLHSTHLS